MVKINMRSPRNFYKTLLGISVKSGGNEQQKVYIS